jgi:hypothetical protein
MLQSGIAPIRKCTFSYLLSYRCPRIRKQHSPRIELVAPVTIYRVPCLFLLRISRPPCGRQFSKQISPPRRPRRVGGEPGQHMQLSIQERGFSYPTSERTADSERTLLDQSASRLSRKRGSAYGPQPIKCARRGPCGVLLDPRVGRVRLSFARVSAEWSQPSRGGAGCSSVRRE